MKSLFTSLFFLSVLFSGLILLYWFFYNLFGLNKKKGYKIKDINNTNNSNKLFKMSECLKLVNKNSNKNNLFEMRFTVPSNKSFIIESINYKKYSIKNNYSDDFIYNINNPQFENGYENFIIIKDSLNQKLKFKINLNHVFDELSENEIIITYPNKRLKKGDLLKSNSEITILTFNNLSDDIIDLKENIEIANEEILKEKIRKSLLNKQKKKEFKTQIEEELVDEGLIINKKNNNNNW